MLTDVTATSEAESVEPDELDEPDAVALLSVAAFTTGTISNRNITLIITIFFFMIPPFLYLFRIWCKLPSGRNHPIVIMIINSGQILSSWRGYLHCDVLWI
jgi:hypothetical protein